jgi:hypothetical protein
MMNLILGYGMIILLFKIHKLTHTNTHGKLNLTTKGGIKMEKQSIYFVLFVSLILIMVTGCASPVGPAYTGGTGFQDSILFKLLFISLPFTAYAVYQQYMDRIEMGDIVVVVIIVFFLTFVLGSMFAGADPQEIQDRHYGLPFVLISAGGGSIGGIIIGKIREYFN